METASPEARLSGSAVTAGVGSIIGLVVRTLVEALVGTSLSGSSKGHRRQTFLVVYFVVPSLTLQWCQDIRRLAGGLRRGISANKSRADALALASQTMCNLILDRTAGPLGLFEGSAWIANTTAVH